MIEHDKTKNIAVLESQVAVTLGIDQSKLTEAAEIMRQAAINCGGNIEKFDSILLNAYAYITSKGVGQNKEKSILERTAIKLMGQGGSGLLLRSWGGGDYVTDHLDKAVEHKDALRFTVITSKVIEIALFNSLENQAKYGNTVMEPLDELMRSKPNSQ